jgi:hypothetical protein
VNDQQDSLSVPASTLNLELQLLHRLNNSLARMGDVYLSHGISHKGCLTSADADAHLALSRASVPHFHAHHAGMRASVDLDGRVIAGDIDGAALRYVQEWAMTHRDQLEANWEHARRAEAIVPIEPLA